MITSHKVPDSAVNGPDYDRLAGDAKPVALPPSLLAMRRIRACESETAAQMALEMYAYKAVALNAHREVAADWNAAIEAAAKACEDMLAFDEYDPGESCAAAIKGLKR